MTADAIAANNRFAALAAAIRRTGPRGRDFFVHVLGQIRILRQPYPGVMHALIFWGVTIQVLNKLISLMQTDLFIPFVQLPFPRGAAYLIYEAIMDGAGLMILIGALMAAFRRIVLRPKTLESRWDDYYAIALLLLLPLAGFALEGLRLLATAPAWADWTPMGNAAAGLLRSIGVTPELARALHPLTWWTHMLLGLLFAASIPFTKLRHLVTAPLNVILRPLRQESALEPITDIEQAETLGVGEVSQFKPQQLLSFDACVRCGRCEAACPVAASGMPFSPRTFIQSLRGAMVNDLISANGNGRAPHPLLGEALPEAAPWFCTTCGACLTQCPAFVNPVAEVIELRRYQMLTAGKVPKLAAEAVRNLERQGNPWGMPAGDRAAWAEKSSLRVLGPGEQTDVLLFVGCAFAYDDRNRKAVNAFVRLLQKAGVDFAILGEAETCCGETARRLGHEYLFQTFAQQNIETLAQYKFNRIVTQCPHCFNTLKNEYPQFGGAYRVQHYTEFLAGLCSSSDSGQSATGNHASRVTYHDSCYLGRYNQIYAPPRALLDRAGVRRVEMKRQYEGAMCCGGGGGQMWLESDPNTRINQRRLADALEAQADVIATACPYCLLMFDDAIRSRGVGDRVRVMDVAEIMADGLSAR